MEDAKILSMFNRFAVFGEMSQTNESDPVWNAYPEARTDRVQSLLVFLHGYAFERAGRAPDYSKIAVEIVKQRSAEDLDAKSIWDEFCKKFVASGVNPKVNPLAPRGTEYTFKGRKHQTEYCSVIEMERTLGMPLVGWILSKLENEPRTVHNHLKKISGVGDKIASFFMRDIACKFNIFPLRAEDRHLLQPIDRWTKRAAEYLGAQEGKAADFLVERSGTEANRPERVNQGIWYFGAMIVGSEEKLKKFIQETSGKDELICTLRDRIEWIKRILQILES